MIGEHCEAEGSEVSAGGYGVAQQGLSVHLHEGFAFLNLLHAVGATREERALQLRCVVEFTVPVVQHHTGNRYS